MVCLVLVLKPILFYLFSAGLVLEPGVPGMVVVYIYIEANFVLFVNYFI